jgi:hypothetical protein
MAMSLSRLRIAVSHIAIVLISFFTSFGLIFYLNPFPGNVIEAWAVFVLITHILAGVVAVLLPVFTKGSCVLVFAIGFLAPSYCINTTIRDRRYLQADAVADRFSETFGAPIPSSVSSLRFVPLEDKIEPNLMFQFDVSPEDFDSLLAKLNLDSISHDSLANRRDFFRHVFYMPMGEDYRLFQGRNRDGNVITIKTNARRSQAVVRVESARLYEDRERGSNSYLIRIENEALEALRNR